MILSSYHSSPVPLSYTGSISDTCKTVTAGVPSGYVVGCEWQEKLDVRELGL